MRRAPRRDRRQAALPAGTPLSAEQVGDLVGDRLAAGFPGCVATTDSAAVIAAMSPPQASW